MVWCGIIQRVVHRPRCTQRDSGTSEQKLRGRRAKRASGRRLGVRVRQSTSCNALKKKLRRASLTSTKDTARRGAVAREEERASASKLATDTSIHGDCDKVRVCTLCRIGTQRRGVHQRRAASFDATKSGLHFEMHLAGGLVLIIFLLISVELELAFLFGMLLYSCSLALSCTICKIPRVIFFFFYFGDFAKSNRKGNKYNLTR